MNHSKLRTLLGATVPGLGAITAVDPCGVYVLITDTDGLEHHRFTSQLEHVHPSAPQPYEIITRRIGYGLWDEVHSLIPAQMTLAPAA